MFSISTTSTFINTFDPMMGSMILILGDVPIPLFLRLESSTKPCPITVLARNHIHEVPNHVAFTLSRTFAKKKILYRQRTCLRHPFVLVQVRFTSSSVFLFRFLCKFCVLRRSKDARAFARFSNCNAPAGSRTRGTSMGGLCVAATLQALLFMRWF